VFWRDSVSDCVNGSGFRSARVVFFFFRQELGGVVGRGNWIRECRIGGPFFEGWGVGEIGCFWVGGFVVVKFCGECVVNVVAVKRLPFFWCSKNTMDFQTVFFPKWGARGVSGVLGRKGSERGNPLKMLAEKVLGLNRKQTPQRLKAPDCK